MDRTTTELLSQGLCFNDHNCSEEEKGGPERGPGSVVNNNQPKGHLLCLRYSVGDDTRQLNNAEQTGADSYPLKVSTLHYSIFFIPVFFS